MKVRQNLKTLILDGSPAKNGQTQQMIKRFTQNLSGEIKIYRAYEMTVSACIDCKYCFSKPGCSIKDDMQEIYQDLADADILIIASPMHFGTISAPLFTLATRLQSYWPHKNGLREIPDRLSPKFGALLMPTGGKWVNMELLAIGIVDFIYDHTSTKNLGQVFAYCTDSNPVQEQKQVLAEIDDLAIRLQNRVQHNSN